MVRNTKMQKGLVMEIMKVIQLDISTQKEFELGL